MTDQVNNLVSEADAPPRQRRRNGDDDADLLIGSGFENLPEFFERERLPVYELESPCFLGLGREARMWDEGSIIVLPEGKCNGAMRPLNRAAAIVLVKWYRSLPAAGVPIDIGDMAEAAQTLGSDPDFLKLNRFDWEKAVAKFAIEVRMRREGRSYRDLAIGHNFTGRSASTTAPLLGAKMASRSENFGAHGAMLGNTDPGPANPQVRQITAGERR